MYLDAADEATIINQGLGAALKERGILFMAYDHNTDQPVYPYRVLQGYTAKRNKLKLWFDHTLKDQVWYRRGW